MKHRTKVHAILLSTVLGVAAFACKDSDPPPSTGAPLPTDDAGTQPALYGVSISVFDGVNSTTYVALLDSFDTQPNVTLDSAREFGGYAAVSTSGGKVMVNDGESPKITRFSIGADKSWTEDASLSFSSYSQKSLIQSIVASETKAYAPFDVLGYVAWDPSTFTLGAEVPEPSTVPLERDGLTVERGYSHLISGSYAYQPFYYSNPPFYTSVGKTSLIGVLDTASNQWVAAADVACPHLHVATKDDEGNLYFSPGQFSVPPAVLDATFPRNCMVRIKPGQTTVDDSFTLKFSDLTEGREGNNFYYIGNGIGFFNAYHAERDNVGPGTSRDAIIASSSYHLWTLNVQTKTASIMQGIDFAGGQYTSYRVDGRVFVAIPQEAYSSTAVYEITAAGTAEKRFETQGWAYSMFRIR